MVFMIKRSDCQYINRSKRSFVCILIKIKVRTNRVVNRAGLFGSGLGLTFIKASGLFWADTMLANKLSKNEIILLLYIYSMYTNFVLRSCKP